MTNFRSERGEVLPTGPFEGLPTGEEFWATYIQEVAHHHNPKWADKQAAQAAKLIRDNTRYEWYKNPRARRQGGKKYQITYHDRASVIWHWSGSGRPILLGVGIDTDRDPIYRSF